MSGLLVRLALDLTFLSSVLRLVIATPVRICQINVEVGFHSVGISRLPIGEVDSLVPFAGDYHGSPPDHTAPTHLPFSYHLCEPLGKPRSLSLSYVTISLPVSTHSDAE
jgi:hypothetical protein